MNLETLHKYCISKKGTTAHFPFDDDTLVFKVGNKMFAIASLASFENGKPSVSLKCNPEKAQELRANYDDIQPGWHLSKIHWNTINVNKQVADKMIFELIDHSYGLIFNSLSKKLQTEII
jgi:predicted DNA-binding protein (MmcQ/YjbR family)